MLFRSKLDLAERIHMAQSRASGTSCFSFFFFFLFFFFGQPEPSSRARPDSIGTSGPDGGCGTHKAAGNGHRHEFEEEVRSPPNQPLGGAGWAGRTAEPSGYGLQVRLAVRLATRFVYRPACHLLWNLLSYFHLRIFCSFLKLQEMALLACNDTPKS